MSVAITMSSIAGRVPGGNLCSKTLAKVISRLADATASHRYLYERLSILASTSSITMVIAQPTRMTHWMVELRIILSPRAV